MRNRINIDELLGEEELVLVIGGKDYVVTDIPLPKYLKAIDTLEDPGIDSVYMQLSIFLDADIDVLKESLGIKAATMTLKKIQEWMSGGQEAPEGMSDEDVNKLIDGMKEKANAEAKNVNP